MRNLVMLLVLAFASPLAGCSIGTLNLGATNYKGQPLSAVVTKLGSPEEQGTIEGRRTYTWIRGSSLYQCRIRVVMAGDVIDTYEGSGDIGVCSRYGASSGGLQGYGG